MPAHLVAVRGLVVSFGTPSRLMASFRNEVRAPRIVAGEPIVKPVRALCHEHAQIAEFLTSSQVSRRCGVHRHTVTNWRERGWIHGMILPNGRWLFCELSLAPAPVTQSQGEGLQKDGQDGKVGPVW